LRLKGATLPISPFMAAINQICDEKNLPKKDVIEAVEAAIAAAYRKEYCNQKDMIRATMNDTTGKFDIFQEFEVVKKDELEHESFQKTLKDAKFIDKNAKIGSSVQISLPYKDDFGRIAAQTAKQVIVQRLRESERNMLFDEYKEKTGEVISGTVQQIENRNIIIINIGKTNALLPSQEQLPREHYYIGQRLRVFVKEVKNTPRGPHIIISRSHPGLLAGLFQMEVPEILSGTVEIKGITREPGSRAKIAIVSNDPQLDPVGTCVGQRGSRIQSILAEIGDEKIDIIVWDKDIKKYLTNALSPARVDKITLSKDKKTATVKVDDDQLSLAIGKNGQNVRLASKLVGIEVDIIKPDLKAKDRLEKSASETEVSEKKSEQKPKKEIIKKPLKKSSKKKVVKKNTSKKITK